MSLAGLPEHFNFPKEEKKILNYWKDIDAFQTSLKLNQDKPTFTFYDGPPFATGLPHYGHILTGTIKDIVTRYAHNTGHHVERRFGWDTHGLPVENEIDKQLDVTCKDDVVNKIGIEKYNASCRAIVMRYAGEWRSTVERMARWIDFDNDYKTLNPTYMESVWWVFKQLYDKGQIYQGQRVMPYSTGCTTPLSNFESTQNYKDVTDPALVVSFPLVNDPTTSLLVWTTTPWSLPSNLAICVHPTFKYLKIHDVASGNNYIVMEKRLSMLYKKDNQQYTVLDTYVGSDMKGWKYVPLFDYFHQEYKETAFRVVVDAYVGEDAGTGLVHTAPAFGEDDYRVCLEHKVFSEDDANLPLPLDETGHFTKEVPIYEGMYIKEVDKVIQKDIKAKGRLVVQSQVKHNYPFCWRSDTPLIYRAVPSWFVRVAPIVDKILARNKEMRWVPANIREKRFANWLANARDWNISRNRYWGTPIPIWMSDDGEEIVCVGSVAELEELSGVSPIKDLHRESIDSITIPSSKKKGTVLRRVEEVFDCWFESGSMPYAQRHYPFEKMVNNPAFPTADFISEGIDQTRGWFYTLLVLSTHLFNKPPAKNVIVCGLVLASDGKKMSKRLQNYPEPHLVIEKYGADALRLYLIHSPVVRGENLKFKEEGVKEMVSQVLLPWYHAYKFFLTQVAVLKKDFDLDFTFTDHKDKSVLTNVMDRWVLATCQSLVQFIREEMAAYRLYTVVPRLLKMIDTLTNWYVRFNRKRLKGEYGVEEATMAMNTLFEVLLTLCKTMAPFTPFLAEHMYLRLKKYDSRLNGEEHASIHFLEFPSVRDIYFDPEIERTVERMQRVIEQGRTLRERKQLPLKTPLKELVVVADDYQNYHEDVLSLQSYIKEELNVRQVVVTSDEDRYGVKYKAEADWKVLGQRLKKDAMKVKKALGHLTSDQIKTFMNTKSLVVVEDIQVTDQDVYVVKYIENKTSSSYEVANSNNSEEPMVLLDTKLYPELEEEGVARDIVRRVQRLRKVAKLLPTDDVDMYYDTEDEKLAELVLRNQEGIVKSLKKPLLPHKEQDNLVTQEEQDINGMKFNLLLYYSKK